MPPTQIYHNMPQIFPKYDEWPTSSRGEKNPPHAGNDDGDVTRLVVMITAMMIMVVMVVLIMPLVMAGPVAIAVMMRIVAMVLSLSAMMIM